MQKTRPWGRMRSGFEDSTHRRVEIRLLFLGWTHARLGEALAPPGGAPVTGGAIRNWLLGRRPWRRAAGRGEHDERDPIERVARAMRVPVEALVEGGPWGALVEAPPGMLVDVFAEDERREAARDVAAE